MGVLRCIGRTFLDLTVIFFIIIFLPIIPPKTTFSSYTLDPPLKYEGPLKVNNKLDGGRRLFHGKVNGPESIASRNGDELFVSLHGGKIMKIYGSRFQHSKIVTSIGPGCAGPWEEEQCGRPLGLRFAKDGKLLIADSYLGLFSLDVDTGEKTLLLDSMEEIGGSVSRIVDDLDITQEGDIYFSDASTIANLANGLVELFSDPTGRLLKFNINTKETSVVLPNIHFANGVQLSPDEDFVLVAETFRSRVLRVWLKGPKAGQNDVFVDRLPGMPDNIRAKPGGGYYVSLIQVHKESKVSGLLGLSRRLPWMRKFLVRLLTLTRMMFEQVNSIAPNDFTAKSAYNILNLAPVCEILGHNHTVIVELDKEGKVSGSLQGNSGLINHISEVHQIGDHLFFGSPYNNYLGYVGPIKEGDEDEEEDPSIMEMEPIRITIGGDKKTQKVEL